MKKLPIRLLSILLLLAGISSSCNPEKDKYPKDVSFTEYSLQENLCQWANLPYDNNVLIINSNEELKKYLSCSDDMFPVIDFTKHSLLLASGEVDKGVYKVKVISLQQFSLKKYDLSVEVTTNDTATNNSWCKALLVEKLGTESDFKLNVTLKKSEIKYPIDIPFEDYSARMNARIMWQEHSETRDKVVLVNSNEVFENYKHCIPPSLYLPIDFSRYTLLIVSGSDTSSPLTIEKQFQRISLNEYFLYVDIGFGSNTAPQFWIVSLMIPKLSHNADVILSLNVHPDY